MHIKKIMESKDCRGTRIMHDKDTRHKKKMAQKKAAQREYQMAIEQERYGRVISKGKKSVTKDDEWGVPNQGRSSCD
jgi:hypothetical protein